MTGVLESIYVLKYHDFVQSLWFRPILLDNLSLEGFGKLWTMELRPVFSSSSDVHRFLEAHLAMDCSEQSSV